MWVVHLGEGSWACVTSIGWLGGSTCGIELWCVGRSLVLMGYKLFGKWHMIYLAWDRAGFYVTGNG